MTPSTRKAYLVASGDLRLAPNQKCWPTQHAMEQRLREVFESKGWILERAHPIKESEGHGFIASQREGMEVFSSIDSQTPLVVAEADDCCFLKAALAHELGINVRFCGARKDGSPF